jgi:phenylalanyl-tRNA synthetase beta chain
VEAAFWWPKAIAGRSRRYNFATDAGHRFERGVDPVETVAHIERITQLIVDICGTPATACGPIDDQQARMPVAQPVTLRVARAAKIIGMPLTQAQCADALKRLGLPLKEAEGSITVTPPLYRFDLQIEEDLIEEVARLVGYDHLPHTPPLAPVVAKLRSESQRSPFAVRRQLAALGYQETINYSFVDERWEHELAGNPTPIKLMNPIASQMGVMRSTLLGSLLQVLKFNLDRKTERVRIFEVGRVFLRDASVPDSVRSVAGFAQPMRVAGLAAGGVDTMQWGAKERVVDFYDAKGDVEALLAPRQPAFEAAEHPAMHPGRCARVLLDGKAIGYVGELHPRWRQGYELAQTPVMFELELDAVLAREVPALRAMSKFQAVERDLAVIVAEAVSYAALMQAIQAAPTKGLLRHAILFDVYRAKPGAASAGLAEGEKSLAVRLTLNSDEATLTEEQIEASVQAVLATLQKQVGARLRA